MTDQANNELTEEQKKQQLLFAQLEKLKLIDLDLYPYRNQEKLIGKYTREQLRKAMEAPELEANQKQLRNISKFLYNASSHYKRLILYFSEILTLDYYLDLYGFDPDKVNVKKLKKNYLDISQLLESMNLKHEFGKVLHYIFKEGAFFGYKHQNKDSFFLQQLDPDYTKITYIEDGLYFLSFNFSYFFVYPERIKFFPDEFKKIWNDKYNGKVKGRSNSMFWEELSSDNTICIKFDETVWYTIPPFIGIFDSLLDISDFKQLQKTNEIIENYKLIFMKMPINDKSDKYNDYLITADHALIYQNNVASVVPEQIGVATVPMEMDVIDFERDKVDKNRVAQSTSQYFSEAGVSELLFSGGDGTVGLTNSIKVDEGIAVVLLRQIERWINRTLKQFNNSTCKSRIVMPEVTIFNRKEFVDDNLKNAQFGLPVKSQLAAVLGLKPSSLTTLNFIENDVLELTEKFVPLVSAHTGGLDEGGAPAKSDGDLSPSGAKTKNKDANGNRAK